MNAVSRRQALFSSAALGTALALPLAALVAAHPDAEVIALSAEIITLEHWIDQEYPLDCTVEQEEIYDQRMEPSKQKIEVLLERFCRATSTTPEGHAARANAIVARFPDVITMPRDGLGEMVAALLSDMTARGVT